MLEYYATLLCVVSSWAGLCCVVLCEVKQVLCSVALFCITMPSCTALSKVESWQVCYEYCVGKGEVEVRCVRGNGED